MQMISQLFLIGGDKKMIDGQELSAIVAFNDTGQLFVKAGKGRGHCKGENVQ